MLRRLSLLSLEGFSEGLDPKLQAAYQGWEPQVGGMMSLGHLGGKNMVRFGELKLEINTKVLHQRYESWE